MEMLLTGTPVTAQRAFELGLVNRVVPPDRLDAEVVRLTAALLDSGPPVLGLGKHTFYALHDLPEDEAYRRGLRHDRQRACATTPGKASPPSSRNDARVVGTLSGTEQSRGSDPTGLASCRPCGPDRVRPRMVGVTRDPRCPERTARCRSTRRRKPSSTSSPPRRSPTPPR